MSQGKRARRTGSSCRTRPSPGRSGTPLLQVTELTLRARAALTGDSADAERLARRAVATLE